MKYMFYIWNIHWNISLGLNLANKEKITFIFLIGINMCCVMHSETYELPEKYMKAISHINSKQIYWTFIPNCTPPATTNREWRSTYFIISFPRDSLCDSIACWLDISNGYAQQAVGSNQYQIFSDCVGLIVMKPG